MSQIGDRLRSAREAASLTQMEVAFRSGLSLATVQRIENGRNTPTLQTLRAMAEASGADLPDLLALVEVGEAS
jgi:transcriptional regulator with XRE-family HTH domain